jgi:hypothetical protein
VALLFGEESTAISDDQAEVASAGLIDAREIDLIENAVTEREPNPAMEVEGSANPGFGARSPARFDSGPAGSVTSFVRHEITACKATARKFPPLKQFARRYGFALGVLPKCWNCVFNLAHPGVLAESRLENQSWEGGHCWSLEVEIHSAVTFP